MERQGQRRPIAGIDKPAFRQRLDIEHEIAVGQRHALGRPRGAGGVDDRGEVLGDDFGKRLRRVAEQGRPVFGFASTVPVEAPDAGQAPGGRLRQDGENLFVGEQRPGAAVSQRLAKIFRRSHVVERDRDRADRREREAEHHLRVAVDADDADRNAMAEAARDQPAGERKHVAVQGAVAPGFHPRFGEGDDCRDVAVALQIDDQALERAVHGVTPVKRRGPNARAGSSSPFRGRRLPPRR